MNKQDFDVSSITYDEDFTFSSIGRLQRNKVYNHVKKLFTEKQDQRVLELNCGTGQDAQWIAGFGHQVLATDISEAMLKIARDKTTNSKIMFEQLDIKAIQGVNGCYDIIFSNFGGLNCLSHEELKTFLNTVNTKLNSGGKLIMVLMPKNYLWENVYLFFTGKWSKLFRRNTKSFLSVPVGDKEVKTWYFNPKALMNLATKTLKFSFKKPIGFFLPPSYMEGFFKNKPILLKILNTLENMVTHVSILSRFSDHYLIVFQKE